MSVEVTIPEIGESISEGFLAEWSQADGAIVEAEAPLLVLETDKITMTVTAEVAGRLEILVGADETVEVGQVVGRIDPDAAADAPDAAAEPESTAAPAPKAAAERDLAGLSPAVRRLVQEHDLDPGLIAGTGKGGRILKGDVLGFLEREEEAPAAPPPEQESAPDHTPPAPEPPPAPSSPAGGERQTRTPMSRLRRRLAERLVEVQQTTAMLTTFNEVDMSAVMDLRAAYKESFAARHGVKLGFMSFFVKAVVDALKTVPQVNAFIDGDDIVSNHYYDIGIAVSSDAGLVVPVVRDADRLSMAGVEAAIAELAGKARDRTLAIDDLTGAVFTITNGGIFGSVLSTPILNPPGSAILGMHAIKKRPVVVDDEIVVRPVMQLAMSYDHRIIDGKEAVTFLKRIVDCLEDPQRLLLEV
ncbi:MAG: 2-oxoglutarate dehydrogenase complex dihydrolipoyllysine-residue succinyltransferase [Thermoanaerobaculales bacterium]|jgi:2-oxoglutarate dehydrogenase E2 component (dihydrolipoamide succinyltransferase)|nr:2-oxoglutarate dehydrogenase complex dihydrolipoyllysine-residue succinyltransferase [Thermoanaerobaculales bacterium]